MNSTNFTLAFVAAGAITALVIAGTAFVNASHNLSEFNSTTLSMSVGNINAIPEPLKPVVQAQESADFPGDEIDIPGAAVSTMRDNEVEWVEAPYPEDTMDRVFAGYGSADAESQAEADAYFDEMLSEFAVSAQSIEARRDSD
jgi:hypothetical protein